MCGHVCIFLLDNTKSEIAESTYIIAFKFIRIAKLFPSGDAILHSHHQSMRAQFTPCWCPHLVQSDSLLAIPVSVVVPNGLNLYFSGN